MSVTNNTPISTYVADGLKTTFALNFEVEGKDNIKVSANSLTVSKNDYSYTATNNSINFYQPVASGTEIKLERITDLERGEDYLTFSNNFRPETLNYDFNRIWKVLQERGVQNSEALAALINTLSTLSERDRTILDAIQDQALADIKQDTGVADLIKFEAEARKKSDEAYNLLAALEAGKTLPELKEYVDNILGIQNPNLLTGITSRLIVDHETGETVKESLEDYKAHKQVAIVTVESIDDLINYKPLRNGQTINLKSYKQGLNRGGGEFYADLNDTTSTNNGITVFVGTDGTRWKRKATTFTFADAGCVGSGDDTAALKVLFDYLAQNGGIVEDFSNSTFNFNADILCTAPNKNIKIDSNCKFYSNNNKITLTGTIEEIGIVAQNSAMGDNTITLDTVPSIVQGDVLAIHNTRLNSFSLHRTYYTDGEFKLVKAVNDNAITFSQELETSYSITDTNRVYKISPVTIDIADLTCEGNGANTVTIALAYKSKMNFKVYNLLNASNSNSALLLDRVLDSEITGGEYIKKGISGTGTDYGLCFSNCQDITNRAHYCYGGRHGVAVGGSGGIASVPNRRVNSIGITIENEPNNTLHAADFHGNVADSYYKDCNIIGRISLAGRNVYSINNKLHVSKGEIRSPMWLTEVNGGEVGFIDNEVISSGSCATLIQWQSSALISLVKEELTIIVKNLTAKSNTLLGGLINITSLPVSSKVIVDGVDLKGDMSGLTRLMTFNITGQAIKPSYIQLTNMKFNIAEFVSLIAGDDGLTGITKEVFNQTGNNANGTWIKQSDGTMICRQRISATLGMNTAHTGGFKSEDIVWTYPKQFKTNPPTIMAISLDNSCASIKAINTTINQSTLFGFGLTSYASTGIVLDVMAIGRHLT